MIRIKNNFDLKSTVTCGQIFRYKEYEKGYVIIIKDRVIKLEIDGEYINITSNKDDNLLEIVNDYFDLNRNYTEIENNIINLDKKIESAVKFSNGLRMIHQDPFETIISYIISQNNRVPSIANSLNLIAYKYGDRVIFEGNEYYLFPSYERLKNVSMMDYRMCKVGFRDKYVYEVVQNINNGRFDINSIYNLSSEDSLNYLISFKGIGNKVASCILLFAYQKFDVYPIGTWVKKFMLDDYNIEGEKNIREFTKNTYKEYSGLAIQYMFNYKRNKK